MTKVETNGEELAAEAKRSFWFFAIRVSPVRRVDTGIKGVKGFVSEKETRFFGTLTMTFIFLSFF